MLYCALKHEMSIYGNTNTALYFFATDCDFQKRKMKLFWPEKIYTTDVEAKHTDRNIAPVHEGAWKVRKKKMFFSFSLIFIMPKFKM